MVTVVTASRELNPGVLERALTSLSKLNANVALSDECARWQDCPGPTRADVVMFERRKSTSQQQVNVDLRANVGSANTQMLLYCEQRSLGRSRRSANCAR